jgi:hypothetical protein
MTIFARLLVVLMHAWLAVTCSVCGAKLGKLRGFDAHGDRVFKAKCPGYYLFFLALRSFNDIFTKQQSVIGPVATLMFQRPPQPSVLRHNMPAWLRWRVLALWNDDSASALFA